MRGNAAKWPWCALFWLPLLCADLLGVVAPAHPPSWSHWPSLHSLRAALWDHKVKQNHIKITYFGGLILYCCITPLVRWQGTLSSLFVAQSVFEASWSCSLFRATAQFYGRISASLDLGTSFSESTFLSSSRYQYKGTFFCLRYHWPSHPLIIFFNDFMGPHLTSGILFDFGL